MSDVEMSDVRYVRRRDVRFNYDAKMSENEMSDAFLIKQSFFAEKQMQSFNFLSHPLDQNFNAHLSRYFVLGVSYKQVGEN